MEEPILNKYRLFFYFNFYSYPNGIIHSQKLVITCWSDVFDVYKGVLFKTFVFYLL